MKNLIEVVLFCALCGGWALGQNQCTSCKCTEYPVPAGCETCCGVIKGKVTAASASHVAVASATKSEDLQITSHTVVEGEIREGDTVTVVYNKETKEAGLVRGQAKR